MANKPTNPQLYSRVKAEAKKKFDRWPSAYGSAWLVKEYKRRGGGYRKAEDGMEIPGYDLMANGGMMYGDYQFPFMDEGGEMALGQIAAVTDKMSKLQQFLNPNSDIEPWIASKLAVMDHSADAIYDYMMYNPEAQESEGEDMEEMRDGGIPKRYKNQGFTRVGAKRQSTRPGKKWMVLAKKGDKYKVVHGGYKGMSDYTQHRNKNRQKRFWDRMGGRDSAKAKDPFSPLYWHKRFGTWAEGGEPQNEGFQALPEAVQAKIMANMMYGGDMYSMGGMPCYECGGSFAEGGQTLYDFVRNAGFDPSFASRKNLLSKYVDGEYTGSAEQNMKLLQKLKSGEINLGEKSKPSASKKPSVSKKSDSNLPKPIDEVTQDTRRFPKTGVVVDRGTNQAFVFGEDGAVGFNVLTGRSDNPNAVYSKAGMLGRRANPNYAVTPTGYFLMDGVMSGYDGNVTGLTGIPAYGVPASPASTRGARIAIHQTYDPNTREPLYELAPEDRRASAGCINCKKEDFERMEQMLPANDTMFVFDSRLPQDANLLRQAQQRYNMESQGNFVRNIYADSNRSDRLRDSSFVKPIRAFKKGGTPFIAMAYFGDGGINLDPAKKGTFKAMATRMGLSVQEAAKKILDAPEGKYSPEMRRKANFARNFAKEYGGNIAYAQYGEEFNPIMGSEFDEYKFRQSLNFGNPAAAVPASPFDIDPINMNWNEYENLQTEADALNSMSDEEAAMYEKSPRFRNRFTKNAGKIDYMPGYNPETGTMATKDSLFTMTRPGETSGRINPTFSTKNNMISLRGNENSKLGAAAKVAGMIGRGAVDFAGWLGRGRKESQAKYDINNRFLTDNLYPAMPMGITGERGNFDAFGNFRPDETLASRTYYSEMGGEIEMTDDQIKQLVALGAEIEILD